MSFQKKSLKRQEQKKKAKQTGLWLLAGTGTVLGAVLLLPKTIAAAFLHRKPKESKKGYYIMGTIFIFFALFASLFFTEAGQNLAKETAKKIALAVGDPLPKDEEGYTNILLLGVGGGDKHASKGHKLTDSIIVVSLDENGRSVSMLSLPRDFWVESMSMRINDIVRKSSSAFFQDILDEPYNEEETYRAHRNGLSGEERKRFDWEIDAMADDRARQVLKEEVEEILDIEIQRIALIDFTGFEEIVDEFGGITVNVDTPIYDPCYPDYEWGYDPFLITTGEQHLSGKEALQYARSRHNYYQFGTSGSCLSYAQREADGKIWNTSSDFDRSQRQQQVLFALKEQATAQGIDDLIGKLDDILDIIDSNFITDLTKRELITLITIGSEVPKDHIATFVLQAHYPAEEPGDFLVTPSRELYGGAAVLVPWLNEYPDYRYNQLRTFADVLFRHRYLTASDDIPLRILNGTETPGLAGSWETQLRRYGITVHEVGNVEEEEVIETTTLRYSDLPKYELAAQMIARVVYLSEFEPVPYVEGDELVFDIVIGTDYWQEKEGADFFDGDPDGLYRFPNMP